MAKKKLRKMLGDVNAPSTVALMRLSDTQRSFVTSKAWRIPLNRIGTRRERFPLKGLDRVNPGSRH